MASGEPALSHQNLASSPGGCNHFLKIENASVDASFWTVSRMVFTLQQSVAPSEGRPYSRQLAMFSGDHWIVSVDSLGREGIASTRTVRDHQNSELK